MRRKRRIQRKRHQRCPFWASCAWAWRVSNPHLQRHGESASFSTSSFKKSDSFSLSQVWDFSSRRVVSPRPNDQKQAPTFRKGVAQILEAAWALGVVKVAVKESHPPTTCRPSASWHIMETTCEISRKGVCTGMLPMATLAEAGWTCVHLHVFSRTSVWCRRHFAAL